MLVLDLGMLDLFRCTVYTICFLIFGVCFMRLLCVDSDGSELAVDELRLISDKGL